MPTQLPRVPSLIPSSFATLAIGRDVSITIFTASSLNSGEKLFFGRGNYFTFPDVHPIGWTVRKARGTSDGLRRAGFIADILGCSIALADIRITQGRLGEAMRTYEQALQLVPEHGGPVLRGTADMHVGI